MAGGPESPKHREACDSCHKRKIKCLIEGPGACVGCRKSGRLCVFSPRGEIGRPRKSRPREDSKVQRNERPITSQSSETSTVNYTPTETPQDLDMLMWPTDDIGSDLVSDFDVTPWIDEPAEYFGTSLGHDAKNVSSPELAISSASFDSHKPGIGDHIHGASSHLHNAVSQWPSDQSVSLSSISMRPGQQPHHVAALRQDSWGLGPHPGLKSDDVKLGPIVLPGTTNNACADNWLGGIPTPPVDGTKQLTAILYHLQNESDRIHKADLCEVFSGQNIMSAVSALCDFLVSDVGTAQNSAPLWAQLTPISSPEAPSTSSSSTNSPGRTDHESPKMQEWTLIFTAVTMVLNLYCLLCEMSNIAAAASSSPRHSSMSSSTQASVISSSSTTAPFSLVGGNNAAAQLERQDYEYAAAAAAAGAGSRPSTRGGNGSTSSQIDQLLLLTVMELHLAKMERALAFAGWQNMPGSHVVQQNMHMAKESISDSIRRIREFC